MRSAVEKLFDEQVRTWPLLASGLESLARARTRAVRVGPYDFYLRHAPHRLASTIAPVDAASIAERPCFLCAKNLPPEQKGIAFNDEFSMYCNPLPIVDRHLTIIHRDHRPQRIAGYLGTMLDLAKALTGYFVIYNGAQSGASAPDHLHFQAGLRTLFPIEKDTTGKDGYARYAWIFRDRERSLLVDRLSTVVEKDPEPMMNLAAFYDETAGWTVYLFPRARHRPHAFHTGELIVSPGAIDLCGIFVVSREHDFVRMTGEDVEAILKEVCKETI